MTRFFKGYLIPLFGAIIAAVILACVFQTQRVIAMMADVGGSVSLVERINMTFYDLYHLGSLYGIFIAIGLFVALTAGFILEIFFKKHGFIIYIIAGMVTLWVLQYAMKAVFFDVHIIAGARDWFGITLQVIAGGFGGKMFYRLRHPKRVEIES